MKINMKKLRTLILILGLVIIAGIGVMLVLINDPTDNRLRYIYNENQVISVSQMAKNDSVIFEKYTGNVSHRSIYKSMYVFVDQIIEKYYTILEKYFDKNSAEIKKDLLLEDKDEFVQFVNTLKVLQGEELTLKQYVIVPESLKDVPRGMTFVMAVDYENNERLLYKVTLKNVSIEDFSPLKFEATDDEYKDYQPEEINNGLPEGYVSENTGTGKVVK